MTESAKRKNSKNSVSPSDQFIGVGDAKEDDGKEKEGSNASTPVSRRKLVHFQLDDGVRWPHIAMIVFNLALSVPVLIVILTWLGMSVMAELKGDDDNRTPSPSDDWYNTRNVTVNGTVVSTSNLTKDTDSDTVEAKKPDYGFPGKIYCASFITWSLFIESSAQILYTIGSGLLLVGALKMNKVLCYTFVVCGILTLLICALIRSAQFLICDEKQMMMTASLNMRKHSPGSVEPQLPPLFKFTFMWLVCQLFWYWLMLSLVVAILNYINKEEEDGMGDKLEESSIDDVSTSTLPPEEPQPPAEPQEEENEKEPEPEPEGEKEKDENEKV